jgi:Domain of unknown function DUF11
MKSFGLRMVPALVVVALLAALPLPASAVSRLATRSADLAITGSPVGVFGNCTQLPCSRHFYFTVTNEGPDRAHNVVATFSGTGPLVGVHSTVSCSTSGGTCVKPWLASGRSINVTVTADLRFCLCNRVYTLVYGSVTSNTPDPNPANNSTLASYYED